MSDRQPIGGSALCLDFSTAAVQCGILHERGHWLHFERETGETLQWLFTMVSSAVRTVPGGWHGLSALVYCRGPGNLLGLRIGGMALSAWMVFPEVASLPLYSYDSLQCFGGSLAVGGSGEAECVVRCQVRRGLEARVRVRDGVPGAGELLPSGDTVACATNLPLYTLPLRPAVVSANSGGPGYCVRDWLAGQGGTSAFLRREERLLLDTFANNDYALWSGERHR